MAPVETNAAGSASTSPPAAEVFALEVDPRHTRGGHGSRLLAACVDLSRDADPLPTPAQLPLPGFDLPLHAPT